jgi:hypothetical protein
VPADVTRGILMVLGIVIHSKNAYTMQKLRVHDPAGLSGNALH